MRISLSTTRTAQITEDMSRTVIAMSSMPRESQALLWMLLRPYYTLHTWRTTVVHEAI